METEGSETENNGKTGLVILCQTPVPRLRSADEPMKLVLRTLATAMASKGGTALPMIFFKLRLGFHISLLKSHYYHSEMLGFHMISHILTYRKVTTITVKSP